MLLWISMPSLFASGKSCHRGFIVFAGADAKGKVAFAMENTRSEGDWWDWTQASQSAWMYDEKEGWVKLKNRFGKPFDGGNATRIGGEWQYQFTGGFQPKMTIHSDENGIHLNLKADKVVLKAREPNAQMVVANGDGALTWKGRRINGKVYMRDEHHLGKGSADIYFQNAKGMHREALHVCVKGRGMLSVVRTNSKEYAPLGGELGLSLLLDSLSANSEDLQMEATAWKRFGLYEFPTEWQGTFSVDGRQAMFKLTTLDYQTTEYLLVAGTRLGWARGFLCFDGETHEIFGLAEVEGHLEGRKQIEEAEWRAKPAEEEAPGADWETVVRGN
jgi:hypothetical protein